MPPFFSFPKPTIMALIKINYSLKGERKIKKVQLEFTLGCSSTRIVETGLTINSEHWDKNNENMFDAFLAENDKFFNSRLRYLKTFVNDRAETWIKSGGLITNVWIKKTVIEHFTPRADLKKVS